MITVTTHALDNQDTDIVLKTLLILSFVFSVNLLNFRLKIIYNIDSFMIDQFTSYKILRQRRS